MGEPLRARAERLRFLASDMLSLADHVEQPSRSIARAERLVAEGERIATATRAIFRGGSCSR